MEKARKAVFLDRDDTLCEDVPYCRRPEDLHLLPGAGESVRRLNDAGFVVVIVTNQSGISRGYLTEDALTLIHKKMKDDLALSGAYVDGIYHCPHLPEDGCSCRKPSPQMILEATRDLNLDTGKSFTVGDRLMDMQMARNAGTKGILVLTGEPRAETDEALRLADHVSGSIEEAVDWILERDGK